MVAVIHLLAGAVVGALLNSPPMVLVVAFFSHYILDHLPHLDPETFTEKKLPYNWTQLISIISDAVVTTTVALLFFFTHERWAIILLGMLSSMSPDLLMPLEKYPVMTPLRRFHNLTHWNRRYAQQWSGFIAAICFPIAVSLIASVILWTTFG